MSNDSEKKESETQSFDSYFCGDTVDVDIDEIINFDVPWTIGADDNNVCYEVTSLDGDEMTIEFFPMEEKNGNSRTEK